MTVLVLAVEEGGVPFHQHFRDVNVIYYFAKGRSHDALLVDSQVIQLVLEVEGKPRGYCAATLLSETLGRRFLFAGVSVAAERCEGDGSGLAQVTGEH